MNYTFTNYLLKKRFCNQNLNLTDQASNYKRSCSYHLFVLKQIAPVSILSHSKGRVSMVVMLFNAKLTLAGSKGVAFSPQKQHLYSYLSAGNTCASLLP